MLGSKFVRFLSILKQEVNSSSNFASFFIVMTHNSSVNFKLLLFILWIKEYHHSPNFVTFKCSGENLPYSSCNFPNHKSVFLQKNKKKHFMAPFYGWGSTASRLELLHGDSLPFTTKFPEIPVTHFIDPRKMKD